MRASTILKQEEGVITSHIVLFDNEDYANELAKRLSKESSSYYFAVHCDIRKLYIIDGEVF